MFYCSYVSIHYIICECGDTFPTEDELKEHLKTEHNNKLRIERNEYRCDTCDKIFGSEKACLIHQRVHTNPRLRRDRELDKKKYYTLKNIVCEVCGKQYASNAALRYHQRVHTGERPYRCSMCPKSFTMPLFLQYASKRFYTSDVPDSYSNSHRGETDLFNRVLNTGTMPHQWRYSYITPIYKGRGSVQDCGSYRGVKIMSHTMKLFERMIDLRLRRECTVSECQYGFQPGSGTLDAIFAIRTLMEAYREKKESSACRIPRSAEGL
nr:zinc finger protein 502-like [Danaus plexippus plexippus]